MGRFVFIIGLLFGFYAQSAVPVSRTPQSTTSKIQQRQLSPMGQLHFTILTSSQAWSAPETIIPEGFYDLPEDERKPSGQTQKDITLDDLYGENDEVPNYGNYTQEDDSYPDES